MGGAWLGWIVICGLAAAQDETTPDKKQDPKPPGKEVIIIGDPIKGTDIFDNPFSAFIVTGNEIRRRRMPRTAGKTHLETPGVHVQQTGVGQGAPFLRGLDPYRSLVLIDGIRLNHSAMRSGPNQYFGTIDTFLVDRQEAFLCD